VLPSAPRPSTFTRATAFLAWALPFGCALARASSHAQWRSDVSAVRDIALGAVGWGGGLSTALTQVAILLPIGSVWFRTALVSCFALLLAAKALHRLSLRMIRKAEASQGTTPSRFAAPALATMATWLATMTPAFQSEATAGGSTMIAVAACLVALDRVLGSLGHEPHARPMRSLVATAFLLGAATAENAVAGLVTLLAAAVAVVIAPSRADNTKRPDRTSPAPLLVPLRVARWALFSWVLGLAAFSAPCLFRSFANGAVVDFGGPFLWGTALPPDVNEGRHLLRAFTDEVGWLALAMVALGAATLAFRRSSLVMLGPAIAIVVADFALRKAVGATEGALALRLLSFAAMSSVSTVGVHAFFHKLVRARFPFARAAAAMVLALQGTLVALTFELASERANRAASFGAESFTDLALERLPASSALFLTGPRETWRMLAATLVEGRRRDALVVSRGLLPKGDTAARLLVRERSAEPLLRVVALTGTSDELALTQIAMMRPLFVEPERGWGPHELAHTTVDGVWVRFTPDPLSATDRKADVDRTLPRLAPLLAIVDEEPGDLETASVTKSLVTFHVKTLVKLGDGKAVNAYLAAVDRPGSRVTVSGSIDVAFAAAVAKLPASRAQKERDKEREKVRQAERQKEDAKPKRKR